MQNKFRKNVYFWSPSLFYKSITVFFFFFLLEFNFFFLLNRTVHIIFLRLVSHCVNGIILSFQMVSDLKKKKTSLKNSIEKFFIHILVLQTYSLHSSLTYESKFLLISRYQTTNFFFTVFCVFV